MEEYLLKELEKEIDFLQGCVDETNGGGWSTHLNTRMINRIKELKVLVYDLKKKR